MVEEAGRRALEDAFTSCRADRARPGKICSRRVDRYRQTNYPRAFARYTACRRELPILRDRDPAHGKRSARDRWSCLQLHFAPATWHRRTDFALESTALFIELENRAGDRGR